jgi:SNF2 family DNA or RNA helicase
MHKKECTATLATNENEEKVIKLSFPYEGMLLYNVKTLPGWKYYKADQCWSVPILKETISNLRQWGFTISSKIEIYLEKREFRDNKIVKKGIPGLAGKLYPFQKRGVAFIERNKGRALIADEMGLGKTIQALAWLQLHPENRPVIIVVPASVKLNWVREALLWMKPKPKIELLMGVTPWQPKGEILVINYDILWYWRMVLRDVCANVLITDECHYYKSNGARRTKAVKFIGKSITNIIGLSGTPIENRPIEMYNAWQLIDPKNCPEKNHFEKQFCNRKYSPFGYEHKDVSGHSNEVELHNWLVGTIMLRRLKKDVLPDLPAKAFSFVPIQLHNVTEYRGAEANFIAFIKETKGEEAAIRALNAKAFTEIEVLKQLSVKGKLKGVIAWIKEFLEVSDKLVVYAIHRFVITALMEEFKEVAVKIDGSVSLTDRQKNVDKFQNDKKIKLFVGNIKAAGIGITLTASSNVAFVELPWTPGALVQAEDRCHRIGQKDSVNIYYLLAMDTVEEKIAHLLDQKKKVLDAVLDGKETEQSSLLYDIIKSYLPTKND